MFNGYSNPNLDSSLFIKRTVAIYINFLLCLSNFAANSLVIFIKAKTYNYLESNAFVY